MFETKVVGFEEGYNNVSLVFLNLG